MISMASTAFLLSAIGLSIASTNGYKFVAPPVGEYIGVGLSGGSGKVSLRSEDMAFLLESAAERDWTLQAIYDGAFAPSKLVPYNTITHGGVNDIVNLLKSASAAIWGGSSFYFSDEPPQVDAAWMDNNMELALFGGRHTPVEVPDLNINRGDVLSLSKISQIYAVSASFVNAYKGSVYVNSFMRKRSRIKTSYEPQNYPVGYSNYEFYYWTPSSSDTGVEEETRYQDGCGFAYSVEIEKRAAAYKGYDQLTVMDRGTGTERQEYSSYAEPESFYLAFDDSFTTNGATYRVLSAYISVYYERHLTHENYDESYETYDKRNEKNALMIKLKDINVEQQRDRNGNAIVSVGEELTAKSIAEKAAEYFGDTMPSDDDVEVDTPPYPPDGSGMDPDHHISLWSNLKTSKISTVADWAVLILEVTFNARTL